MIGTGKGVGSTAGFIGNPRTAVSAYINERLDLPVPVPRNEQRDTRIVVGDVLSRRIQLARMRNDDREITKQNSHFLVEL